MDLVYVNQQKNFTKGWGPFESVQPCQLFAAKPQDIAVQWVNEWTMEQECITRIGSFYSPKFEGLPPGSRTGYLSKCSCFFLPFPAFFQMVLPKEVILLSAASSPFESFFGLRHTAKGVPLCVLIAGLGDAGFRWRKNKLAIPILQRKGIGSILMQIPLHGKRSPTSNKSAGLFTVRLVYDSNLKSGV
jgi:hypothetical protein